MLRFRRISQPRNQRDSRCHAEISRWFLARLIFRTWNPFRHLPLKRRLTFNGLHDVISQRIELFEFRLISHILEFKLRGKYNATVLHLLMYEMGERIRTRVLHLTFLENCCPKYFPWERISWQGTRILAQFLREETACFNSGVSCKSNQQKSYAHLQYLIHPYGKIFSDCRVLKLLHFKGYDLSNNPWALWVQVTEL
jgi:hypothetical protein